MQRPARQGASRHPPNGPTCLTNEREARSMMRADMHADHVGFLLRSGVSWWAGGRAKQRILMLALAMTSTIAAATTRITTTTRNATLVLLDALLDVISWALLRRRPPPAGAAFGRKFADNRCCFSHQNQNTCTYVTCTCTYTHPHSQPDLHSHICINMQTHINTPKQLCCS